jgi:hypothetical protein
MMSLQKHSAVLTLALFLGAAWLIIVVQLLADHWAETGRSLGDMDDAMRLVELRGFIDGQGWFNLHEPRLGPPEGYDTHWSRLIDAGLAGLLWLFGLFTGPEMAERLMRTVWPMLWLLPTMVGATASAWRVAGRDAVPIALVLTAVGLPALPISRRGGSIITMSRSRLPSCWWRRSPGATARLGPQPPRGC